ncbi:MAG: hypothetical protein LC796_03775 [Acidobacteria bacterium]|nr:hypothetical protein [Acidobacteriota bacterium]MCA1611539.1 hypothetical protein [Acidobacteriota bacterium]
MRRTIFPVLALCAAMFVPGVSPGLPDAPRWPLTLREGLPAALPGWAAAPADSLPEENENGMGAYIEVSRFFQRIESSTSTKQFRVAVQDYGAGNDLLPQLRKAVSEAGRSGAETRELDVAGHRAFVVTDRSTGKPTTIVTVFVSGGRLVLGQGANVAGEEALKLVRLVDYPKVAAAR